MKIEITKDEYYKLKGSDELYNASELLRAVISMIRANFNITDDDLEGNSYR